MRNEDGKLYIWSEDGKLYMWNEDGKSYMWNEDGKLYIWNEDGELYIWNEDGKLYIWNGNGKLYIWSNFPFLIFKLWSFCKFVKCLHSLQKFLIHTRKNHTICEGSWENPADVAGSAFELGRLKVKTKRIVSPQKCNFYLGVFFTILIFI